MKHSNIARLYRVHKPKNQEDGILSVYIPGVGTYFPEIGDDGGSALGLGCGAMGEERLTFALEEFDAFLAIPLAKAKAPANAIQEINIAVFGFSRGAALARAFVNKLMELRCDLRNEKWVLRSGAWPLRFRFIGLFDTVASVGLPMSSNTTGLRESYNGDTAGMIVKRLKKYQETRPEALAFFANAIPGADPAAGNNHGHDGWGKSLQIHETVEEVRHFIAAHEIRNSFPLDSVSILSSGRLMKPGNFYETVYPGAHSDVGGGYASGEGAKSFTSVECLSLIPLLHMYNCASRCGVPMLVEWTAENKNDFNVDPKLLETYNYYMKAVGSFANLGEGISKYMALYYAWRFAMIKRKSAGDRAESKLIQAQDSSFRRKEVILDKEVNGLAIKEAVAQVTLNARTAVQEMQASASEGEVTRKAPSVSDADVEKARQDYKSARDAHLRAKARKDSFPNMKNLQAMLDLYDKQLLADVQAIRNVLRGASGSQRRSDLRPHYKMLLEAYENEFEKNNGLKDEKIISFFDNYVHDSLAGFAKDATLPSDPRVVYLGGDEKYRYANLEKQDLFMGDEKTMA
ncbi:T6SS phospholipase effector Tle1-like catalytic domain-containing protein [Massilia niastensis]|uniref:T6SS phospholipase effector Tle1-like catalytic domain-containing protein n=1 Tax=Massilia niastensis TaxID=544911 RepID=UPI0003A8FCBF|nr:DUF2235 domain-containing protein [Massilia niastensis]